MFSRKLIILAALLLMGAGMESRLQAEYSAPKIKAGIADANTANASSERKNLLSRSDKLIQAEQEASLRRDTTPEWRLGYCFQAWFIMMVQYRSALKNTLTPQEAEACTTCMTAFGQKFRKAQKELGLDDDQLFVALGKNPNIPETYAEFWPGPAR